MNLVFCEQHPQATYIENMHSGDLVCPECGLVLIPSLISDEQEWRIFPSDPGKPDQRERMRADREELLFGPRADTFISTSTRQESYYKKWKHKEALFRDICDKFGYGRHLIGNANRVLKLVHRTSRKNVYSDLFLTALLYCTATLSGEPLDYMTISLWFPGADLHENENQQRLQRDIRFIFDIIEKHHIDTFDYETFLRKLLFFLKQKQTIVDKDDETTPTMTQHLGQLIGAYKKLCKQTNINPKQPYQTRSILAFATVFNLTNKNIKELCDYAGVKASSIVYWLQKNK